MCYYDPLADIGNYPIGMSLSKIVMFLKKNNINTTSTMIQHYVKIGLIKQPTEKKHYNVQHLILLVIINEFKTVYSLEEIKGFLILHDTEEKVLKLYNDFIKIYNDSCFLENYKNEEMIILMIYSVKLKKIVQKNLSQITT